MDPIVVKTITIKDIKLCIPVQRRHPVARQYYVEFSVSDTLQLTNSAKEVKNHVSWDDIFYFKGDDCSGLLMNVYQKQYIGKDKLIGSLDDSIGGVLGKLKNGVLEEALTNDTANPTGIMIKFALVAEPHGDVNADKCQAADTITFETIWGVLLQRMTLFDKIVTDLAQIRPYMLLAWSVISTVNRVLADQKNRDDQIIRLAGTMSDVFAFVHDAEPLKTIKARMKTVKLLIQQVTECGYFITEYAKQQNFWIRTAKYTISDIDARITGYETKIQELKTAFLDGVALQTGVTAVCMMNVVKHAAELVDLNDIPYADGAGYAYAQGNGCLPGTRESVIRDLCAILNNPDDGAPRVCLLTGVAGSGKSAVAHSIARLYDEQGRLGSSYCFGSTGVARRNPQNLFSTIARDLSDHDLQYRSALQGVVEHNRALRTSTSPLEQLEGLIIEPSKGLHAIGPLLIVIDALDESGDKASRRELLDTISQQIADHNLPTNLRFLITACPESDILDILASGSRIVRRHLGDVPPAEVDEDIGRFIHHSLSRHTELESSWPNQEWCRLLIQHCQHLFQWASTACKFIQGEDTKGLPILKRFETVARPAHSAGIHPFDQLYRTILRHLFPEHGSRESFLEVMAVVLALKEPLSLTALTALFDGDLDIRGILQPIGSLLDGAIDEKKPIRPLHSSFYDFLLDRARSSSFHVQIRPQHSLSLGRTSLACMRNMLKFNICDLKDSRLCNATVPNLRNQVNMAIPSHLTYSCQYWMDHLQCVNCTTDLLNEVTLFFKDFFPYWLEAISLLSASSPLSSIPSALHACTVLKEWANGQEIATLASEAFQFIQVFTPVLRESTPHLYLSALPQTPSSSPLCKLWLDHLQKYPSVTSGQPATWPVDVHTMQGHTDAANVVAYSHDGSHIVSVSRDKMIWVWSAITGQLVADPFQGHTHWVTSVAYSYDGSHIVSGSYDKTIRVWSATTGQLVAGPFQGHTDTVTSVAYSHGDSHIVSGSYDSTIRVWDATTGKLVTGPLQGHISCITSVAYSPNGRYIVSGSWDRTIRVWVATTGQPMGDPFQGHKSYVTSVAYSPSGHHIVSGSWDMAIMVWNATTGQLVAGPIQGHTNWVSSVAYSPNGHYIVSGSYDKTIRVWNATTGQLVAGPFQGHTHYITSVAYSPDGSHIVSASCDKTIKLWRAQELDFFHDLHEENGWIQSSNGNYFGWIAPWNRHTFHLPIHSLVISSDKFFQIDNDSSLFGESWVSCWKS